MKTKICYLLGLLMILFSTQNSWAQELRENAAIPFKTGNSFVYGGDVIIDDQSAQNQRDVSLSVAFNGWLYAGYIVTEGLNQSWKVLLSQDNGATWTVLINQPITLNWYALALDMVVCGTSSDDLAVYVSSILQDDVTDLSVLRVTKYDGNTGAMIATIWENSASKVNSRFLDVAIASDYRQPAVGASPYSIGVLFSKYNNIRDSIVFLTSSDGGASMEGFKLVNSTTSYVRNVSLAYGVCQSYNRGRYFAAWEERPTAISDMGNIFTAHSEPYFFSDFTMPHQLDNMPTRSEGYCRNPSIACQFTTTNNADGYMTEVVLFDCAYDGNGSDYDIVGAYNLEVPLTENWYNFGINEGSSSSDFQPDLNFDPGSDNFLATYFNSTEQKLRYLVKNKDMNDPFNWTVITDKYNDANNLANPYPKVEINPVLNQVAHIWCAEGPSGNGIAMFDAEYSVVGIPSASEASSFRYSVYPNPANEIVSFSTGLSQNEKVTITLYNPMGQCLDVVYDGESLEGTTVYKVDVSAYPSGTLFYEIRAGNDRIAGRLVIIR